jgi:hypothetical protein
MRKRELCVLTNFTHMTDIFNHDPKAATISFDAISGFEEQEDGKRSFQVRVAGEGAVRG